MKDQNLTKNKQPAVGPLEQEIRSLTYEEKLELLEWMQGKRKKA